MNLLNTKLEEKKNINLFNINDLLNKDNEQNNA